MSKTQQLTSIFIFILIVQSIYTQQSTPQITSDFQIITNSNSPETISPYQQDLNKLKNNIDNNLKAQINQLKQMQDQTKKGMQKLQKFDKQVKSWSQILDMINNLIHGFNSFLSSLNDKTTTLMARVIGFQQQLKAIISIDTLIVCILSLILVKILKDEFIEEGYQPVGSLSQHQPISPNSAVNTTLSERQMEG